MKSWGCHIGQRIYLYLFQEKRTFWEFGIGLQKSDDGWLTFNFSFYIWSFEVEISMN